MKSYKLSPNVRVIKNIDYIYTGGILDKKFGDPIALYVALTGEIYLLSELEYKVFNLFIINDLLSLKDIFLLLNSEVLNVKIKSIVNMFIKKHIIHDVNLLEDIQLSYKFSSAQMYVKLTEGCNFSCPGCVTASDIIIPEKAKTLDIETLKLLLRSFVKSCIERDIYSIKIKWAGGEPLLYKSYKLIVESQTYSHDLFKEFGLQVLDQVILTNGVYIDKDKALFARDNNIGFSISLWGIGIIQDNERLPRNKSESYTKIIENISILEHIGTKYSLSHVITPSNAFHFSDFITALWDIHHESFIGKSWDVLHPVPVYIGFYRPQRHYEKEFLQDQYMLIEKGFRKGLKTIKDMITAGVSIPPLNRIDYLSPFEIIPTSCGSGYNYVAVGPEGVVSCHEALHNMPTNLQDIKAGINMLDIANRDQLNERNLYLGTNVVFKDFPYLGLHGGQGCPRMRKIENKEDLSASVSISDLYLNILDELLSLETLRRLKSQL